MLFQKRVYYHNTTRLTVRQFPFYICFAEVPSIQQRIDSGENPIFVDGTIVLTDHQELKGKPNACLTLCHSTFDGAILEEKAKEKESLRQQNKKWKRRLQVE